MSIQKLLIYDDDLSIDLFFEDMHCDITKPKNLQEAIRLLQNSSFDLVISADVEILSEIKTCATKPAVVITSSFPSVEKAVEAIRLGAFDYLVKPISPAVLEKISSSPALCKKSQPCKRLPLTQKKNELIFESSLMKDVLKDIDKIAKSSASVLILGESGTGKEVVANAIHSKSLRASKPFIRLNCAAVSETLAESEFFGHEKGSFTGAIDRRIGRFEQADSGTLLLDEISEISLNMQAKLLRIVQEQEFERVGGIKPIKIDVRLISTSNRDMQLSIDQKLFRQDLYYRLNVIPLVLPALRERKEDILCLSAYFLDRLCEENGKKRKVFSLAAQKKLLSYNWPGNVRELLNVIERAVILDESSIIEPAHLNCHNAKNQQDPQHSARDTLEDVQKRHILQILRFHQHDKKQTANTLKISVKTLTNKLSQYAEERTESLPEKL